MKAFTVTAIFVLMIPAILITFLLCAVYYILLYVLEKPYANGVSMEMFLLKADEKVRRVFPDKGIELIAVLFWAWIIIRTIQAW